MKLIECLIEFLRPAAAAVVLITLAASSYAQTGITTLGPVVDGADGISGRIFSVFVNDSIGASSGVSVTPPMTSPERAVVKQWCYRSDGQGYPGLTLNGNPVISIDPADGVNNCLTFNPGLSLSSTDNLFCWNMNNLGTVPSCIISGYISNQ